MVDLNPTFQVQSPTPCPVREAFNITACLLKFDQNKHPCGVGGNVPVINFMAQPKDFVFTQVSVVNSQLRIIYFSKKVFQKSFFLNI